MYVAGRVAERALGDEAATLIRLEGFGPSVAARSDHLSAGRWSAWRSSSGWKARPRAPSGPTCATSRPFADGTQKPVWRLSATPTRGHEIVMSLRMEAAIDAFYDWQGGLVWLKMEAGEPEADLVREALRRFGGGHATLVRASESVRAGAPCSSRRRLALAGPRPAG